MRELPNPKTIDLTFENILTEALLAGRWGKSVRTLQRLRVAGEGPPWFAIGRSIFYRLNDILAFEAASLHREVP
jgi:hypothetical protein